MANRIDLNTLRGQTVAQVRKTWVELKLPGDPPPTKQAIVRGIAWSIQERRHGGLDSQTRRLLKAAVRSAPAAPADRRARTRTTRRETTHLATGTKLVRTWRGRRHEVTALEDGKRFRYGGADFDSLSEIAREITGARWSGPRFFGLTKLKGIS